MNNTFEIHPDMLATLISYCEDYADTPRKRESMLKAMLKKNNLHLPSN